MEDVHQGVDATATLRALYPRLRGFAAVVAPLEMEPDDLVQEALARVLASPSWPEIVDIEAYTRRTMVNLASNERRRLGRARAARQREVVDVSFVHEYPSDVADLDRLSPVTRALLCLVVLEGWAVADAAVACGCTALAARARLSRARRQLRDVIESEPYDE